MFPKQRCPVCQNRAWQVTTSGSLLLENAQLKQDLEDSNHTIKTLLDEIDALKQSLEHFKKLDNHGFHHEYDNMDYVNGITDE